MPEGRAEGAGFALVDAEDADALESEELEDPQAARARALKEPRASTPKDRLVNEW